MIESVHVHCTQHLSWLCFCLIDGLLQLGIRVSTNVELGAADGLTGVERLSARRVHDNSEDVLVLCETRQVSYSDVSADPLYDTCANYLAKQKPVLVFNMEDDVNLTDYPEALLTFTTHVNRFAVRRGSILPAAFGVSSEMIQRSSALLGAGRPRQRSIIRNFNPTYNQSVRDSLDLSLIPGLSRGFAIDDRRLPKEEYWASLTSSLAILAYGGSFVPDLLSYPYLQARYAELGRRSDLARFDFKHFEGRVNVLRWDSWRFWEACCFGCPPIQLDFEKYGFVLPVMPVPWVHYIPLDLEKVGEFHLELEQRMKSETGLLDAIGRNARQWAVDNYSPKAVATRMLEAAAAAKSAGAAGALVG